MPNLQTKVTFKMKGLEELNKNLKRKIAVNIGVLGKNNARNDGASNASIGVLHEFGSFSQHLPARSWLKMPLEIKQDELTGAVAEAIETAILEPNGITTIFRRAGIACEKIIQEGFETGGFGNWAPLSPATIKEKKGNTRILIDTSQLRRSITSEVINQ